MTGRVVAVFMWAGVRVVQRLWPGDPDPTLEELDAIATARTADNDGVRPVARVLAESSLPGDRYFGEQLQHVVFDHASAEDDY